MGVWSCESFCISSTEWLYSAGAAHRMVRTAHIPETEFVKNCQGTIESWRGMHLVDVSMKFWNVMIRRKDKMGKREDGGSRA